MPGAYRNILLAASLLLAVGRPEAAAGQTPGDLSDPSLVAEQMRPEEVPATDETPPKLERSTPANVDVGESILVGAIRVEGASELPASAFAPVLDNYIGRTLSPEDLKALASAIADVARGQGYGLASAWIPQQRISNAVLKVMLDEGRIDEVVVQGSGADVVQRILSGLANGKPVKTAELERRLLVAGDVAGIQVGRASLKRSNGRNQLVVRASRDRVQLWADIDNWGSSIVGPVRARLTADINGLIADDDRLTIGGAITPLQPREFAMASLGYAKGIGSNGTELQFESYYAVTNAGGQLAGRDREGESLYAEIGINHPLVRSRSASLWAYVDFGYLAARQSQRDIRFRDDRIAAMSASLFGTIGNSDSRARARLAFRQGLDVLGATEADDPLRSRRDGSGSFSKLEFWAAYDRTLGAGFGLGLQAAGQIASRPLLSSEEIGLGGRYFLRGYDYREYSGDKGIAGSVELRFNLEKAPRPLRDLQFYAYADAGTVGNYRGGFGSGSLASAGGGLRARLKYDLDLGIEVGVPLRHGAVPGASYNPRISFVIAARF